MWGLVAVELGGSWTSCYYLWVISQSFCPSVTHLEQKCEEKKLVGRRADAAGSSHMGLPCLQLFTDYIIYTPSLGLTIPIIWSWRTGEFTL